MFLSGLLTFLFGCKQSTVNKTDLIGVWQGTTHNNTPITNKGFYSIKLTITNDSVEVIADMNSFGGHITTKSYGPWSLDKNIIKTKFGDNEQESIVNIDNGILTFKPEAVSTSQYKKTQ